MDLIDNLQQLATKVPKFEQDGTLQTEEATKNALVMPFINALGYNVFDPIEVIPEFTADHGIKKGEKVDYAIFLDGKPIILIECKTFGTNLKNVHASQLFRYFAVTSARVGILTNGVIFQFFSDLDEPNKMDSNPFFVLDITKVKEYQIEQLKQFRKSQFDEQGIVSAASELKYKNIAKTFLVEQLTTPTDDFIKVCMQHGYSGRFTNAALSELRPIVRDSLRLFVNEQVEQRLKSALARETVETEAGEEEAITPSEPVVPEEETPAIVTTQDEIEAYYIVKSMLRETIESHRIVMRDSKSYCALLFDDNNRKPLCRLRFNGVNKYIGFVDDSRNEERIKIDSLDDIYMYKDRLIEIAKRYL